MILGAVAVHDGPVVSAVRIALFGEPGEVVVVLPLYLLRRVHARRPGKEDVAPLVDAVAVLPEHELGDGVDDLGQHVAPLAQLLLDPLSLGKLGLQLLVGVTKLRGALANPLLELVLGRLQLLLGLQLSQRPQVDRPGQAKGHQHEEQHQRRGLDEVPPPRRQIIPWGEPHADVQRQPPDLAVGDQPGGPVGARRGEEGVALHPRPDPGEHLLRAGPAPEVLGEIRSLRVTHYGAEVRVAQGDAAGRAYVDGGEHAPDLLQLYGAVNDPGEGTVRGIDAPGDDDHPFAADQPEDRPGNDQAGLWVVAQGDEVVALPYPPGRTGDDARTVGDPASCVGHAEAVQRGKTRVLPGDVGVQAGCVDPSSRHFRLRLVDHAQK